MNKKFIKNAKCIVSTNAKENMKKVNFFILSFFIMSSLSMPVQAASLINKITNVHETVNTVKSKVNTVQKDVTALPGTIKTATKTQLQALPTTIQDQFGITLDDELVKQAQDAVAEVGKIVLELKEERDKFEGDKCDDFKESLTNIFTNLGDLSLSLATSVDLPVPATPKIDLAGIPCNALLGPSLILNLELRDKIKNKTADMTQTIKLLLDIYFDNREYQTTPTTPKPVVDPEEYPVKNVDAIYTKFCEEVVNNRNEIDKAAKTMRVSTFLLHTVASKLHPEEVNNLIDIPKLIPRLQEFEAGLWGFAGITVGEPETMKKISQGLKALATSIDKIEGKVSDINSECMNTYNQSILDDQQDTILENQAKILELLSPPA